MKITLDFGFKFFVKPKKPPTTKNEANQDSQGKIFQIIPPGLLLFCKDQKQLFEMLNQAFVCITDVRGQRLTNKRRVDSDCSCIAS